MAAASQASESDKWARREPAVPATMRAVQQRAFGTDMRAALAVRADVPVPVPAASQVLVRVEKVSLHAGDWHLQSGDLFLIRCMAGGRPPRTPGGDMAGTVAAVGPDVDGFTVGQRVWGLCPDWKGGALAEFALTDAALLQPLPDGVSTEVGSCIGTSGVSALQALRAARELRKGDRVLVIGASGGVGHMAVQLAKALGAAHVTGVCSGRNADMVRALGADEVVDYTTRDYHDCPDDSYDLIIDTVGGRPGGRPATSHKRMLKRDGVFVFVAGPQSTAGFIWHMLKLSCCPCCCGYRGAAQKWVQLTSEARVEDLRQLSGLLADGRLRAHVGRRFESLDGAADAFELQGSGHAAGKSVITVPAEGAAGGGDTAAGGAGGKATD